MKSKFFNIFLYRLPVFRWAIVCVFATDGTLAWAQVDYEEIQSWDNFYISSYYNNNYSHGWLDEVVAENDQYLVIKQNGGTSCPGGDPFWLVNKERRYYRMVSAGTCSENVEAHLTNEALVFTLDGEVVAKYPY